MNDLQAKTVLVIHSSQPMSDLLLTLLKSLPLSTASATTADEGKRLFRQLKPDLVILGLIEDWLALLQEFRAVQPSVEIVVLTGSDQLAQQARSLGFDNVLLEDDHENLAEGIQYFLGEGRPVPSQPDVSSQPDDNTILVVDDEAEIRKALSEYLSARGYNVLLANTGKMALTTVERNPSVSVIVLDLVMPEMGGLETLKELKIRNKEVGVIVLSGFADREIVRQALKLGAFDVMLKPVPLHELEAEISACIASLKFRKRRWWRSLAAGE